jgi:hypothetical protein
MMDKRWSFAFLVFAVLSGLVLCGGCVAPQVIAPKSASRSALEQELISTALRKSLGEAPNQKLPFSILEGMKVAVEVSCISQSNDSEDSRFVKSLIVEKLLEEKVTVVETGSEEAVLKAVVDTLGTDVGVRSFPHIYLPLFYYITYKATASVTLYAYDAKGKQMGLLLSYQGKGEETAKEWSLLGLGPFK